jgi:hypothetical protein
MSPAQELATLKRESREALNRARALSGLPLRPPVLGPMRRLAPDDLRVVALKKQAGFRGPHRIGLEERW